MNKTRKVRSDKGKHVGLPLLQCVKCQYECLKPPVQEVIVSLDNRYTEPYCPKCGSVTFKKVD